MSKVNQGRSDGVYALAIYGAVTQDAAFTAGGTEYVARCIIASAEGTIDIVRPDGVTVADMPVFKGYNPIQAIAVSDVNGLTLHWGA